MTVVKRCSNQKPWLTGDVRSLLRSWETALRCGDVAALARSSLKCGIKEAKRQYTQRLNGHFIDRKDLCRLWQGFKSITDYKLAPLWMCHSYPYFPGELNTFYACYEAKNTSQVQAPLRVSHDQVLHSRGMEGRGKHQPTQSCRAGQHSSVRTDIFTNVLWSHHSWSFSGTLGTTVTFSVK